MSIESNLGKSIKLCYYVRGILSGEGDFQGEEKLITISSKAIVQSFHSALLAYAEMKHLGMSESIHKLYKQCDTAGLGGSFGVDILALWCDKDKPWIELEQSMKKDSKVFTESLYELIRIVSGNYLACCRRSSEAYMSIMQPLGQLVSRMGEPFNNMLSVGSDSRYSDYASMHLDHRDAGRVQNLGSATDLFSGAVIRN